MLPVCVGAEKPFSRSLWSKRLGIPSFQDLFRNNCPMHPQCRKSRRHSLHALEIGNSLQNSKSSDDDDATLCHHCYIGRAAPYYIASWHLVHTGLQAIIVTIEQNNHIHRSYTIPPLEFCPEIYYYYGELLHSTVTRSRRRSAQNRTALGGEANDFQPLLFIHHILDIRSPSLSREH